MSELDRLTEEATSKAVIAVGREAAKRAVDQLISGEEKPSAAEAKPVDKNRGKKILALSILGLFLVVGVVGLLLHYWLYFLAAGVLGVAAMIGWSRLRKRFSAPKVDKESVAPPKLADASARVSHKVIDEPDAEAVALAAEKRAEKRAEARAEAESKARALAEAEAVREQEVDDELRALKARMKP